MVNKKKYAVGKKLRDELDKLNNTLYENLFIPKIMEDVSQKFALTVDDEIYEALRTKIEFTITQFSDSQFDIKIKDVFKIDTDKLSIFVNEMELNLREQYGNTK